MSLPPGSMIKGLYNKFGSKARLTFKKDLDQLWIGTTERTQKLPLNSIKSVTSQPIAGFEEYHILALQLGPTEKSNYYLYWVPAQYIDTIKEEILGIFAIFQQ
ncbi:hypothetical protein BKA69DRAFT_1047235 [Paraphysoderma sedebokerense]|nr:hypothetical protein BKA69DRAFT_1047235 [Paraphysoderma sedebokerense]